MTPRPGNQDDWSGHWSEYANSAQENPAQQMRHELILDAIKQLAEKPGLLIDVGSGPGDFLAKAVSQQIARDYVGFELSDTGVNLSRTKVPSARFILADILSPPVELAEYGTRADMAVCTEVLEHVDTPALFLQGIGDYLKPGGYLLLSVPGGPMSAFDHHIGHRKHFSAPEIRQLLEASGFTVKKTQLAGFPFFNLYRLSVILRGRKLISDVSTSATSARPNHLASLVMGVFKALFRLNLNDTPFGWQVIAIARKDP